MLAAGILAQQGHLNIEFVIAVAAGAAVAGDNLGYLLGRKGGRSLLLRAGPLERQRRAFVGRGERFFGRAAGEKLIASADAAAAVVVVLAAAMLFLGACPRRRGGARGRQ